MKLILSHPTSQGGSITYDEPVTGVALVAVEGRVFQIRLIGGQLEGISRLIVDGIDLGNSEVWFIDERERTEH